jgi:hypothetical protein
MFEYMMYVSTPSRQVPPTNDATRQDIRSWMKMGSELFNREDMNYIATNGAKGQPPQKTSVIFPWGGHAVMRSGWDAQAQYVFFDVGPSGVSHQHEDKLHIGVSAYGRDFLTDGGKGLYIPDKWRNYFLSTRAHNTILIDGFGQRRIPDHSTHRAQSPLKGNWFSDESIDFAGGVFENGYGPDKIPVKHSRYVLYKKEDYWLIIDELSGEGEHTFESLFHFTADQLLINEENQSIQTQYGDGKNIRLSVKATVPVDLNIVKGQENPEQGWIYHGGERLAKPTAVIKGRGKLPIQIITAIEVVRDNKFSNIHIDLPLPTNGKRDIKIAVDEVVDRWTFNLNEKNILNIDMENRDYSINIERLKAGKSIEQHLLFNED